MRKCEHCKKEIYEGHVMFDYEFYLCNECFEKFYDFKTAEFMYDNELQYWTIWEEEEENNG